MTATNAQEGALTEVGRARAETVLRAGCLEALRVALLAAGYPVVIIRDRTATPDRLWIEPKGARGRQSALAVGCARFDDGWWFYRSWGPRIARVDELDTVVRQVTALFEAQQRGGSDAGT